MTTRKFFKSNASRCKRAQIRDNYHQNNKRFKPDDEEYPDNFEHDDFDTFSDSGLSEFETESSTSLISLVDFEDNLYNNELEPLFRCSTPVSNVREKKFASEKSFEDTSETNKQDLWEKAMNDNPSLRNWIESFNDEMKLVEESELIVKKTRK